VLEFPVLETAVADPVTRESQPLLWTS